MALPSLAMCLATPAGRTQEKANFSCPSGHCFSTPQRSVPAADPSYLSCLIEWIQPHIIGSRSLSISVCHTGYWAEGCSSHPALPRPWVSLCLHLSHFTVNLWIGSEQLMLCSDGICVLMELVHFDSLKSSVSKRSKIPGIWMKSEQQQKIPHGEFCIIFLIFRKRRGHSCHLEITSFISILDSCTSASADWPRDRAGSDWIITEDITIERQVFLLQPCSLPVHLSYYCQSEISFFLCFIMCIMYKHRHDRS